VKLLMTAAGPLSPLGFAVLTGVGGGGGTGFFFLQPTAKTSKDVATSVSAI